MAQIIARGRGKWLVRVFLGRGRDGKPIYKNRTISGTKKDAENWGNDRERERDTFGAAAVQALDLTIGGLLDDLIADYRINGKRDDRCESIARRFLKPAFGKMRPADLTTADVKKYITERQESGATNATINRELAFLRRAFNLAANEEPPRVMKVPRIPTLAENNVRKGFFEDADYRALMRHLPEDVKPILAFGYLTGCRKGEILGLRWNQVDLAEGIARLNPGETKNDEPRIIPLVADLLAMLDIQRAKRDAECPDCPWVFFHDGGLQWRDFRESWKTACKAAGLWQGDDKTGKPTKLFHDLRRSGVRNLVRAGVPEKVAMTISGHKTRAVFERYNVVDETDLKRAARQLGEYLKRQQLQTDSGESHTIVTQTEEHAASRVM